MALVKNISVTQRLSVSWCSGNLMKIQFYCDGDLCFKDWIRVDGSGWICGLQSPTNFTKWIKSSVFIKFLNKFSPVIANLPVGPCWNHRREADICLEANDWRILKQKIGSQLYSTAGDGTWSLEGWRGGLENILLLYF